MFKFIAIILIAIAYRGKGGGFATWGITEKGSNNVAHGLGALLASLAIAMTLSAYLYIIPLAICWFLFTKPSTASLLDMCSGFTQQKFIKAMERQLYAIPMIVLMAYLGSYFSIIGFALIPIIYWIGGLANRTWGIDPVIFAEWSTGIIGLTF